MYYKINNENISNSLYQTNTISKIFNNIAEFVDNVIKYFNTNIFNISIENILTLLAKLFKTLDSVKILPVKKPFIVYSWKDYVTQNTKFNLCVEIPLCL